MISERGRDVYTVSDTYVAGMKTFVSTAAQEAIWGLGRLQERNEAFSNIFLLNPHHTPISHTSSQITL